MKKLFVLVLTGLLLCVLPVVALAEQPVELLEPEAEQSIIAEQIEETVPEVEEFVLGGEDMPSEKRDAEEVYPSVEFYATDAPLPMEPEWDGTEVNPEEQAIMAAADDFIIEGTVLKEYNGSAVNVVIPDGISSVGRGAFFNYSALQSVVIPEGVVKIEESAFKGCTGLQSIKLPNSLTIISANAFEGCSGLQSITIPSNVTTLGNSAFEACKGIRTVIINGKNLKFILGDCFLNCHNLESINLPDCVTEVGYYAFAGTGRLSTINLSNNLTSIGERAFKDSGITKIHIPGTVKEIPTSCFENCEQLTELKMEEGIEIIGYGAFRGCKNLRDIIIPNSVTDLKSYAFRSCQNAYTLSIGSGIETIGEGAFANCKSLTSITLPDNIRTLKTEAFAFTENLKSVKFGSNLTTMDFHAFAYGVFESSGVVEVELPEKLTVIPERAFARCGNLSGVIISNSVTKIGNYVFNQCPSLLYVVIPKSVTVIGTGIFDGCKKVTAYVEDNSYAYDYCVKNRIPHKRIGEPLPHNHVRAVIPGYPATCTQIGLTDGVYCTICNEILIVQKTIPVVAHTPVYVPALAPTCIENGHTEGSYCAVCGVVLQDCLPTPATGHTPVYVPAQAPRYQVPGHTDGAYCAVCNTVLQDCLPIPALTIPEAVLSNVKSNGTVTLAVGEQRQIIPSFAIASGWTVKGYQTSKPTIASIDPSGLLTATAEGKARITVTTVEKKKATLTVQVVDPYKPSAVAIAEGRTVTIAMGQPLQLNAVLAPETARATLTWTSSKPKVAIVDANGLVIPQGEGRTKITVQTHNRKKAKITVQVVDPYKPVGIGIVQGKALTLQAGTAIQLNAVLNPVTAQSALTWTSKKPAVASVDANGVVTALKKGRAKITVATYNKKRATIIVNVVE